MDDGSVLKLMRAELLVRFKFSVVVPGGIPSNELKLWQFETVRELMPEMFAGRKFTRDVIMLLS